MTHTPGELIAKYIEIRDYMKAEADAFAERMKPYDESLTAIEGTIGLMLNEQGLENLKSDMGTAYKTHLFQARVSNKDALMEYVTDHGAYELLTAAVSKDAVKDFMAEHQGNPPPGVDVSTITKVNFRRS